MDHAGTITWSRYLAGTYTAVVYKAVIPFEFAPLRAYRVQLHAIQLRSRHQRSSVSVVTLPCQAVSARRCLPNCSTLCARGDPPCAPAYLRPCMPETCRVRARPKSPIPSNTSEL
jgi:hypothetical protein